MGSRTDFEDKVKRLVESVKQHLATDMGLTLPEASTSQIYYALSRAVRDRIMPNWVATRETLNEQRAKMVYYISAEFMIGRLLGNNLVNTNMYPVFRAAMDRLRLDPNVVELAEAEPGLGNGGLGRLAACFLDSLATLKYPAMGYGLRYHYGIFRQEIRDGWQVENPDGWLQFGYPWEIRRPNRELDVLFGGRVRRGPDGQETLTEADHVRAVPYDYPVVGYDAGGENHINTLRLWSASDDPRNFLLHFYQEGDLERALENQSITNVLYPKDNHEKGKWLRLKQEYFLVSSAVQDIMRRFKNSGRPLRELPDAVTIHINDTHPALVVAELMLVLSAREGLSWGEAFEITRATVAYTNHTILAEALEKWDVRMLQALLPRQYRVIERVNQEFCDTVRARFPADEGRVRRMSIIEDGRVHMARLALAGSYSVNGVAKLHTSILRQRELKDFDELWPERFHNVTNGVTPRRWLVKANPELADFFTERLGSGWITDFQQIAKLADFADEPASQDRFLAIKRLRKEALAAYIRDHNPLRDAEGRPVGRVEVNPDSIFDVMVKRLHEYKRQLMNGLQILMTARQLRAAKRVNRVPRTFIFGAKAPTGYHLARAIIKFLNCVARHVNDDPAVRDYLTVVFLENYNVGLGELVFPAADLSEQISCASREASGTGNMKFAMNGALTIGTDDGANVEMREAVGDAAWRFKFGLSSDDAMALMAGGWDPAPVLARNPEVRAAVDMLRDGSLARDDREREELLAVYQSLVGGFEGDPPDRFLVLRDLEDYHETQGRVDKVYRDKRLWASLCLRNIAGMGRFSSDVAIRQYCDEIWNLRPIPFNRGKVHACARELGLEDSIFTLS